jgi:uncharacterized repeat protein (TIGR03803 family)
MSRSGDSTPRMASVGMPESSEIRSAVSAPRDSRNPKNPNVNFAMEVRMSKLSSWKTIFFSCVFCAATATASSAQADCSVTTPCFTNLVSFSGTDGSFPVFVPLVQGFDGNFYGTTSGGGAHSDGTVFKITPEVTLTTLHNFAGADGSNPAGGLALTTNGVFYGTTVNNGAHGYGTVFKMTSTGALTTLHSFDLTDGANPYGGLIQATDGNFYGTTHSGGSSSNCSGGCGTVFKMIPSGTLTTLHSFDGADGAAPFAGLVQASDGNFYGITYAGGAHNDGVVFKMTMPTGTVTVLHSFDGTHGANSYGALIQAINGILYGMTAFGGTHECNLRGMLVGCGTIFKITLAGVFTTLHNFDPTDGAFPSVELTQATDGNFYGTTYQGGANGVGTIFKVTAAGALTTLHTFDTTDGISPNGLLEATNGEFSGTTLSGGAHGDGTIFSLSVGLGPFVETLPISGKVGTPVIILGNNLAGSTSVTFNGTKATFRVSSTGTAIKTTVPSGATTGKVKVTTTTRTLTSNVNFRVTPTISSFSLRPALR